MSGKPKSEFTPSFGENTGGDTSNVLPPGTRMAEFELLDVIGEGGFGIVYRARDHSLDRIIAIKEYMPSAIAGRGREREVMVKSDRHRETFEAGLRSFVNEAKLLARFDHPALVKVYRFWEINGTAYMAMPFYEGLTLKQALKELGVPPQEAWLRPLLLPLLDALSLIHEQQCFHRDIAPDNILVLPGHKPLLLDFGAARRVIGDMTQMLTVFLKPGYAPIEQYADMPGVRQGPWTDLYALGAVLYNALTGSIPPPSVGRMMNDNMPAAQTRLEGKYSQALLRGIDRCLAIRPEDRLQSAAEFKALLDASEPPTETPTPADAALAVVPDAPLEVPVVAQPLVAQPLALPELLSEPLSRPLTEPLSEPLSEPLRPAAPESTRPIVVNSGTVKKPKPSWMPLIALLSLAIVGAGGYWVWRKPAAPDPLPVPVVAPKAPETTATPVPVPTPTPTPTPATTPAPIARPDTRPVTSASFMDTIVGRASPEWKVVSSTIKPRLVIDKDRLQFSVRSDRNGYLYVWMLGTDGKEIAQIFPNAADQSNRVLANKPLDLPRTGWALEAAGPVGKNRLLMLVVESPQEFRSLGLKRMKAGDTSAPLIDIEAVNTLVSKSGRDAVIDSWNCQQSRCPPFGVSTLEIEEVVR